MATTTTSESSDGEWWKDPTTIQAVRQYAQLAGLLYCPLPNSIANTSTVNVTITLHPSKFPKELYDFVWEIQPHMNSLVDAVSRDHDFLKEALDRY